MVSDSPGVDGTRLLLNLVAPAQELSSIDSELKRISYSETAVDEESFNEGALHERVTVFAARPDTAKSAIAFGRAPETPSAALLNSPDPAELVPLTL